MKILDFIYKGLQQKAAKEQHEVVKLQWQVAKLQQQIDAAKRAKEEESHE